MVTPKIESAMPIMNGIVITALVISILTATAIMNPLMILIAVTLILIVVLLGFIFEYTFTSSHY